MKFQTIARKLGLERWLHLRRVSDSRRSKSGGQITCYLNRTYHVLPTFENGSLEELSVSRYDEAIVSSGFNFQTKIN